MPADPTPPAPRGLGSAGLPLLAGGSALALAAGLALSGAPGAGALAIGAALGLGIAAVAHPLAAYVGLLGVAVLADQHLSDFSPWTDPLGFYLFSNGWTLLSTDGVPRLRFLVANSVDLLLAAIALGVVVQGLRGRIRLRVSPDVALGLLLLLTLCAMLAWGLATGGGFKPALWQSRPFFYFAVFALAGSQLLERRRHVEILVAGFVAASVVKAAQIVWLFVFEAGARFGQWRSILGHQDSIFLASVLVLAVAMILYGGPRLPRVLLGLCAPLVAAAVLLNLRRTAYVALALCLGAMPLLLHGRRRAALGLAALGLVACAVYAGVALRQPEAWWAMPVQKARTIVAPDAGSEDSSSNRYRAAENTNLARTVAAHPAGLGFGHPFELHVPIDDISYLLPLWRYHPHNMILGIWIALGTLGFVIFLGHLGAAAMLASHGLRWQRDPQTQAICYFLLASVASGLLASWLDQFVWSDRGALFLGAVVAMSGALHRSGGAADPLAD